MKRILPIISAIAISSTAIAAEPVEIITRYTLGTTPYLVAMEITNKLNQLQTTYEFKLSAVSGAAGESADQRAIALARNGQNVLLFTAKSSWTTNRYAVGMTFDRDNDLVPLYGVSGINQGLAVAKNKNINTVDELVAYIKSKPEAYVGYPQGSVGGQIYDQLFREKYNITNVKGIFYSAKDMNLALQNGEMDYTFWSLSDLRDIKTLMIVGKNRLPDMMDVPTITELKITNSDTRSISLFAVPKERRTFGEGMISLIKQICNTTEIKDRINSLGITASCLDQKEVIDSINDENKVMEQYKDMVKFR